VLDPEATAAIRELREKANRTPAPIPADAPYEPEMVEIALGPDALIHWVGYTIDLQPATAWHHLIVGLKDYPDRLPSLLVISELMEAFNFVWKLRLPLEVPPMMTGGSYAMIGSARELPLVYRTADAPALVNVVEPLLKKGRPRDISKM
jgi:hypothetical protein